MTIGDIAPKINSQQVETHCCSKNKLQNISVLYKHTNIRTIKNSTTDIKANFFNLLITYLPHKLINITHTLAQLDRKAQ